jgi:hypothetical protein
VPSFTRHTMTVLDPVPALSLMPQTSLWDLESCFDDTHLLPYETFATASGLLENPSSPDTLSSDRLDENDSSEDNSLYDGQTSGRKSPKGVLGKRRLSDDQRVARR